MKTFLTTLALIPILAAASAHDQVAPDTQIVEEASIDEAAPATLNPTGELRYGFRGALGPRLGTMPIIRINRFSAKQGSAKKLYDLVESFLPMIQESDGCLTVQLLRGVDDPHAIVVIETWVDQASHQASAKNIPPDVLERAMALMSGPPSGAYYE